MLKAIAAPRRRRILRLVWNEERSAGEIADAFDITFGAISQHLRVLREAGAVEVRRAGRHRYYRARRRALGPLAGVLEAEWKDRLGTLRALAEQEAENDG